MQHLKVCLCLVGAKRRVRVVCWRALRSTERSLVGLAAKVAGILLPVECMRLFADWTGTDGTGRVARSSQSHTSTAGNGAWSGVQSEAEGSSTRIMPTVREKDVQMMLFYL